MEALPPLRADGLARHPRLSDVTRKVRYCCTLTSMPPRGCVAVALLQLIVSAAQLSLRADGWVRWRHGYASGVRVHAGVQASARMGGFLRDKAMLPVSVCMRGCEAIEADPRTCCICVSLHATTRSSQHRNTKINSIIATKLAICADQHESDAQT